MLEEALEVLEGALEVLEGALEVLLTEGAPVAVVEEERIPIDPPSSPSSSSPSSLRLPALLLLLSGEGEGEERGGSLRSRVWGVGRLKLNPWQFMPGNVEPPFYANTRTNCKALHIRDR